MTDVRPHSGWTLDKPTNPSNIRLLRIQMLDAQLAPVPFNTVQCLKPEWAWRPAEWECEFGRVLGCLTTLPTSGPAQLKQAKWLTQTLTSLRGAPHVIGLLGTYESIKDEDQPSRYHRLLLQYPGNSLEMLVHGFRYTLGRPQPPAHHTSRVPTDLSIQGLDVPSPQLRGGLPLKEVFELAIGLASALKTLHANRLTVGPLRPSGISLSPWGTWMLTDVFRLRHLGSPSDPDLPFHRLPQRRFFGCSDREDDIWSLGLCVLYALFGDEPWPYIVQSVTKLEHVPDTSRCLKEYESLRTNKAARKRFSTRLYAGLMRHPRLRRHFGNNKQLSAVVYFASCCLELHPAKLLTAKRAHATLLSTFAIRFN
ncbi:MAG: hypothetical protein KVP17_002308 [Porospora cf. gigantea B]|nr:MAG: hypothetical protein KVP17_002308 [Porospora cf. gigantea B]